MSYYYLISSLPAISIGTKPAITMDEFRSSCAGRLSASDAAALDSILDIDSPHVDHPFAKNWIARETQLRNASARFRAAKNSRDAVDFLREHLGFDVGIENSVEEAFNHSNPLERERALDTLRWTTLDDIAGSDPLSVNNVLAYAVKLKIAERWSIMDANAGKAKIEKAVSGAQEEKETEQKEA